MFNDCATATQMKIVIAPQEFKESLTGIEIALAMQRGVKRVWRDAYTELVPMADGGDGTLQSLVDASNGSVKTAVVEDPLGEPIEAEWGALGDGQTAVIEMARCSGLALLTAERRDPLITSTYGVGQLMLAALDQGYRHFIIGIGGSATNDGGAGMAQALGVRFLDADGKGLSKGGGALSSLERIDISGIDARLDETSIDVACDTNNPLCGETGASVVYGPQKGADPATIDLLDNALRRYGEIVARDVGKDVMHTPGSGASGGLGAGLMAFTNARLRSGADIVIEAVELREKLKDASLAIVGEGQTDRSTIFNKAPIALARIAKERGIPVIAVSGSLGEGYEQVLEHGIDAVFSVISRPMSLTEAMENTARFVADSTEQACRAIDLTLAG